MTEHEKINYVEYLAKDIGATKRFFETSFGWSFVDYGPDYSAFSNQGVDGGFFKSELASTSENGAALIVFYSQNLESSMPTATLPYLMTPLLSCFGSTLSKKVADSHLSVT